MIRQIIAATSVLAFALYSAPASAGVYADDLAKCLVKSSNANDQTVFVQWMFAALSLNPNVKQFSVMTGEQRDTLNREAAALYQRLIITDCHNESRDALKYEGPAVLAAAFQVFGQVAARGLMSDPETAAGMRAFTAYIDQAKMADLLKEAGIQPPPPPAAPAAK